MVAELGSASRTDPEVSPLEISDLLSAPPSRAAMADPSSKRSNAAITDDTGPQTNDEKKRSVSRPRLNVRIDEGGPKTPDRAFDAASPNAGMPALIPADCSTADLREYVVKALTHHDAKIRETQRQVEADAKLIMQTSKDLNEYTRKHDTAALDKKTNGLDKELQDMKARNCDAMALDKKVSEMDKALQDLKTLLDNAMTQVDATMRRDQCYLERVAGVEQLFQEHVAQAFSRAESDLKTLGTIVHELKEDRRRPQHDHDHDHDHNSGFRCSPCGAAQPSADCHDADRQTTGPSSCRSRLFGNLLGMQGQADGTQARPTVGPPGFPVGGGLPVPARRATARHPEDGDDCKHCQHVTTLWARGPR